VRRILAAATLFACAPRHDLPVRGDSAVVEDVATVDAASYPTGAVDNVEAKVGDVFPDIAFEGYPAGSSEWSPVAMHDFYDPDGKKGIRAILLVGAVSWCPACNDFAKNTWNPMYQALSPRGLRLVHTLRQGGTRVGDQATRTTVEAWATKFSPLYDNLLDARERTFAVQPDPSGTPWVFVIDPRTMQITATHAGGPKPQELETLLVRNGG
jgi:hypothetical protein